MSSSLLYGKSLLLGDFPLMLLIFITHVRNGSYVNVSNQKEESISMQ